MVITCNLGCLAAFCHLHLLCFAWLMPANLCSQPPLAQRLTILPSSPVPCPPPTAGLESTMLGPGFGLTAQQAALLAPLLAVSPRHPSGVLLWPQAPQQAPQLAQQEQQEQPAAQAAGVAATPAAAAAEPTGFATITPAAFGASFAAEQQRAEEQGAPSAAAGAAGASASAAAAAAGKRTAPEPEAPTAEVAAASAGRKRAKAAPAAAAGAITSPAPVSTHGVAQATPQPATAAAGGRGSAKPPTPAPGDGATSSEEQHRRRQRKTAQPRRSSLDGHAAPPKAEATAEAARSLRSYSTPAAAPAAAARTPAAKPPPAPRKAPAAAQAKGKAVQKKKDGAARSTPAKVSKLAGCRRCGLGGWGGIVAAQAALPPALGLGLGRWRFFCRPNLQPT